jgi:serine protease Do
MSRLLIGAVGATRLLAVRQAVSRPAVFRVPQGGNLRYPRLKTCARPCWPRAIFIFCFLFSAFQVSSAEPDIRRDATVLATERVMPSVVNIATETVIEYHEWYDDLLRQFYGSPFSTPRRQRSVSLGSGVIIDEEGYILTNLHVVRRASRIQVKLSDGREFEADPLVVGTAVSDVALIKLRGKPGEKFNAIKFAPDDDLLLGETVLALGNPYGLGTSVTKGILSSKNRRPPKGDEPLDVEDWLQTDAAINPGNSGGPLVNLRGELIGLNVAVYREEHGERGIGLGFSIPVKQVSVALSRFFTPELTDSLWFGAQLKAGSPPLTISSIQSNSPAAKAGLREGDAITQVNGDSPRTLMQFNRKLVSSDKHLAKLQLRRGNETLTVFVKMMSFDEMIRRKLGLSLLEPTAAAAQRMGIREGQGLFVDTVEAQSPAANAGFQKGYLLTGIEGATAADIRTVGEILAAKNKGDKVELALIVPRRRGSNYVELQQGSVQLEVR